MKRSELIKKLQEAKKKYGDIEVLAVLDAFGNVEFVPLEDVRITFYRFNKGKNVLHIDW